MHGAKDSCLWSGALPTWFALYTRAHRERTVKHCLQSRGLFALLPEFKSEGGTSRPLFPGYVFVQTTWHQRRIAVQIPSVVHMVHFSGEPAVIPEDQLKPYLLADALGVPLVPWPYLKAGTRVKVRAGPFKGIEAVLDRRRRGSRLVLNIDMFARAAAIEVDADLVEIVTSREGGCSSSRDP